MNLPPSAHVSGDLAGDLFQGFEAGRIMGLTPRDAHRSGKEPSTEREEDHLAAIELVGDHSPGNEPERVRPPADPSPDRQRDGLHRRAQGGEAETCKILVHGTADQSGGGGEDQRRTGKRLSGIDARKGMARACGKHDVFLVQMLETQPGHVAGTGQAPDHQVYCTLAQLAHEVEMRPRFDSKHHFRAEGTESQGNPWKEPCRHRGKDTYPQGTPRTRPESGRTGFQCLERRRGVAPEQGTGLGQDQPSALPEKKLLPQQRFQFGKCARKRRLRDPLPPGDGGEITLGCDVQKCPNMAKLDGGMYAFLVIHSGVFCIIQRNSDMPDYVGREDTMQVLNRPWGAMHYRIDGPGSGPVVIFANSLGTDLRLWDALLPLLPQNLRYLRYDKQGHGLSDLGPARGIAELAEDAAGLIDATGARSVVFVGLSIGGLIGQALAAARPELVRALVLSNTAARIGTAESWTARVDAVRVGGIEPIGDAVMERWFAPAFRATPALAPWRNMLVRTPPEGYARACEAIAAADLTTTTAALRLPTLVIAGSEDGATPPDLVAATAALLPGAAFHTLDGAGHLPCVERPEAYAALLTPFLKEHAR